MSSWIQTKNRTWIGRVPKSESSKEDGGYVKIKEEHYYEARPFGWVPQEHQESPENHQHLEQPLCVDHRTKETKVTLEYSKHVLGDLEERSYSCCETEERLNGYIHRISDVD